MSSTASVIFSDGIVTNDLTLTQGPRNVSVAAAEANSASWIVSLIFTYVGVPVLVMGTLGNLMTIVVLLYAKSLRTMPFYVLLIFLAVADIGVLSTVLLRYVITGVTDVALGRKYDLWVRSDWGCRTLEFLRRFFIYLSPWTLVLVTAERFISVCHPFLSQRLCRRKWAIIGWLCVCLSDVCINVYHPARGTLLIQKKNVSLCVSRRGEDDVYKAFSWVTPCLISILPGLAIIVMNTLVIRSRKCSNDAIDDRMGARTVTTESRDKAAILITVGFLFLFLALPVNIVANAIAMWGFQTLNDWTNTVEIIYKVAILLSVLNNACNFMLYCMTGVRFRQKLRSLCRCQGDRRNSRLRRVRTEDGSNGSLVMDARTTEV